MSREVLRWGLIIFLVAAFPRLGWVGWNWNRTGSTFAYPDEELHWQLARNLVEQGELRTDDGRRAARMPLYPLFLALFASAEHYGVLLARIVQALIGATTACLIYVFMHREFGQRPALLAAGLAALDPFTIFFCNLLLTETLFIFFGVALTVCAWPLIRNPGCASRNAVFGVGVCAIAAILTRPSAAGWIGLLWILLWLYDPDHRRGAAHAGLYLAIFLLGIGPWGIRNYRLLGAPAWLSANGGVTLYDAQGPQAVGDSNQDFLRDLSDLAGLDEIQRDRILRDLAWRQMYSDPSRVLRLAFTKFCRTWNLIPNVAEHSRGASAAVSATFTAGVLILAMLAVARFACRRAILPSKTSQFLLLMLLPVVYFTLLHCVFVGSVRYRIPLMPFLEMCAGLTCLTRLSPTGNSESE